MKVNLSVQGQPLFLSPDGLVPRTRLQDDWEGDPNDFGGGHGPWRQDQEAQRGGGGVSPALPDHRRRHGQEQELGLLLHPQGDVGCLTNIYGSNASPVTLIKLIFSFSRILYISM